ncbi:hypothetical protein GCM10010218_10530 [Streptomyces mashuensis]|uniref:Integral membrane protein n=2 Tax=Streptomyces mashuensis TaxID=33904 RepID=A0A919AZV2_9ACTN|nr:hypothetical protein GCM10010218_10530 [Streptomyces mashuensis]
MDISAARPRALRAALFTALCVLLSASSHVLLSGMPLPAPTVAATCAGVFALAYALAGRERGYGHIAALLVPLELAAGALFRAGQDTCGGGPGGHPPASTPLTWLCGAGVGGPLARVAAPGAAPWVLLAGHVVVALLGALWLRRGEAALVRLLAAAAAAAVRPLRLAAAAARPLRLPPGAAPRAVRRDPSARPRPGLFLHSVVRRGPPAGAAALA